MKQLIRLRGAFALGLSLLTLGGLLAAPVAVRADGDKSGITITVDPPIIKKDPPKPAPPKKNDQ